MKRVCEDKGRNGTKSTSEGNGTEDGGATETNEYKAQYG